MLSRIVRAAAYTRPANTTTYAQHDVMAPVTTSALLEFALRDSGAIFGARVLLGANQTTAPALRLYLFEDPPAVTADNAPIALSDAEAQALLGIIDLSDVYVANAGAGAAGAVICQGVRTIPFKHKTTKLVYGKLVVNNAYVPTSGELVEVAIYVGHDD